MANQDESCDNDDARSHNIESNTQNGFKACGVNRGFQRWKMLSNVVKNKKYNSECQNSEVKRLKTDLNSSDSGVQFHTLYKIINFHVDPEKPGWIQAFWNQKILPKEPLDLRLKLISKQFSLDEIAGFDNSGNVRLWPCEELLSYLCSFGMIRDRLKESIVCELGAGMTALAGLISAKLGLAKKIILSDGNERSVENVQEIVQENFYDHNSEVNSTYSKIDVRRIRWENPEDYRDLCHSVEIIICADCLFVPKYHQHLLNTLDNLLVLSPQAETFQDHVLGSTFLNNNSNNHYSVNATSSSNISDSSSGLCDSSSSLSDSRSNISDSSSNLVLESNSSSYQSFPSYSFSPASVSSSSSTSSASASSSPYHKNSVQVFIVAPQRDNTLESFIHLVRLDGRFRCSVLDHFDESFFSHFSDSTSTCENNFLPDRTEPSPSSVEKLPEESNNHPYDNRNNADSFENLPNKHITDDSMIGSNEKLQQTLPNRDHHHNNNQHRPFLLILTRI